jgi:hypothetical protein
MSKSRPSPKIFVIGEARICRIRGVYVAGFLAPSGAAAEAGKWGCGRPGRRSHCDAYELVSQDGAGDHRQELSIVA